MTETTNPPQTSPSSPYASKTFRRDIQGLRALAVASVVLYHVEAFRLPGGFVGVDVFFVISGFLITGHLVRDLERTGRVAFAAFYANRIRRLLPVATVVLVTTTLTTYVLLPATRWHAVGWDIIASAIYAENWRLANGSVDYLTQDSLPSPVQHFWSLGVEEQFYIIWPLVLALAGLRAFRRSRRASSTLGRRLSWSLFFGLAVIAVPSFVWSVLYTGSHSAPAYYATTTRLWELAVGGFVAILSPWFRRLTPGAGNVTAWGGVMGIVASVFVVNASTAFPGAWAALPTLATAAVIGGGYTAGRAGPGFLLESWTAQRLGDMSYSIYLWHWPLIIAATIRFGEIDLSVAMGIVFVCVILSYLSWRFVEQPARRSKRLSETPQVFVLAVAMVAAAATAGGSLVLIGHSKEQAASVEFRAQLRARLAVDASGRSPRTGAGVLPVHPRDARAGRPVDRVRNIFPSPLLASEGAVPCESSSADASEVSRCFYGDPDSKIHVALVGDSHALQWLTALAPIAEERGWALTGYIHYVCPFADGQLVRGGKAYTSCINWNAAVSKELLADTQLAAIFTSSYTNTAKLSGSLTDVPQMTKAYEKAWARFTDTGVHLIAIRDTPKPSAINVAECVALNETSLKNCGFPRRTATQDRGVALMAAAEELRGATPVDLNEAICPTAMCAPVIGGTLVYRDSDHVSGPYIASLQPRLEKAIAGIPGLG